jgi:AraC family transcriptional regulator
MKALARPVVSGTPVDRGMALSGLVARGRSMLEYHAANSALVRHREPSGRIEPAVTSTVTITPPELASRRRVSWRGMAAETIHIAPHARCELRCCASAHVLLVLFGPHGEAPTRDAAPAHSIANGHKAELVLVPAGHDYVDLLERRSLARLACFYFDPTALPLDAEAAVAPLFFEDADLRKMALKLTDAVELEGGNQHYREALGIVLAYELARLAHRARRCAQKFRGGLAGWQQQAVTTHIDQHLAERISLASLAALARLSPFHFARAFKQSFGIPPHRYHTHRRIAHAKALLADSGTSATEIGMAVGFSSASSFTMTFRKATGMTPTDYRRIRI